MKDRIEIEDIKRIHLNKGDVLKVKVGDIPAKNCELFHKMLSDIFPNNEVLVVNSDIEFEIIEGGKDNV